MFVGNLRRLSGELKKWRTSPPQRWDLPEPTLVLVDGGEAVSVDRVEVVLVGDAWGDDLRVHHEALAPGAALMQRLKRRKRSGGV